MKLLSMLIVMLTSSLAHAGSVRVKHNPDRSIVHIDVGQSESFNQRDFDRYMKRHGYDYRSHHYANKRLRQRVRKLEQAVLQLQEEVFRLKQKPIVSNRYVCVLETRMHGTFMAKDRSKLGAQGKATKKCEKEAGDYWCKKAVVSCDYEA